MKKYYRVTADIDLDAIYDNISNTRKIINNGTKIMAIIKADGYGHGAVAIAKCIDEIVDAYGVSNIDEAIEIRKNATKKPILILGYTAKEQFEDVIENDITQAVYTLEQAQFLSKCASSLGKVANIHIKLDTGMTRIGFKTDDDSVDEIVRISGFDGIKITGIFTHFSKADETDKTYTKMQLKRYTDFVAALERRGINIPTKHVSNSAAIIDLPEANFDMVRSGISTYGLYPSEEVDKSRLVLKQAMSLHSHISFIKEVDAGVSVSYGGRFVTDRKTRIATIPVGYADGYPRNLSGKGYVLIEGKAAPILGRVCMDQFMVDITDIKEADYSSVVTLLGRDMDRFISVEELSELAGTFNYEFVCDISKRVPRVFYRHNKVWGTQDFTDCYDETYDS